MLVHQILKSKADDAVVTVPQGTTISQAVKILAERKIGTVVVSDDEVAALGIVSERDIVRELSRRGQSALSLRVEEIMTSQLVTCTRMENADDVLQTMTERRFRHMPVVEDGALVGLVTLGDVVKARLGELAMEKEALEGMIMGH